jgi:adenylate kinase family enzyme
MFDNYLKYIKYKQKYIQLQNFNMSGGNKNNKFILLDGTSSSGKTTICNFFNKKNFLCFKIDDYFNDKRINYNKLFKKITNNYGEMDKIYKYEPVKYMINDAIKINKNIIFDHVSQTEIIEYLNKKKYNNLFIINVFTNLKDLSRNLESRRKKSDIRGMFAFNQFSNRYIKCNNDDINKIEIINRKKFKEILFKIFKYEFEDEEDLINFSIKIFNNMNIIDDEDYFIKLREKYKCDYLLITTNKTKIEIFKELEKIIL